ncbi:MAG: glycosyltransferase [Desulfobacterales bacterium]|nr:glycosyltransferase [Desulfobacterales bacterium]
MKNNVLDIIIVNYESTNHLLRCLESIYNSIGNLNFDIIVLDNGSGNDIHHVANLYPNVKINQNSENIGFSKAVNQGLGKTSAKYVLLINPDIVLKDGFFKSFLSYMEKSPDIGILGPKIFDSDGEIEGSARAFPSILTAFFGRNSFLTRYFPNNPITRANILTTLCTNNEPVIVDWISGACMLVRKKAIEQVGMMDERFFIYWEDADWCRRMWGKGWKVIYYPEASAQHFGGASSNKNIIRSVYEFHRSAYFLFNKYTKWPKRILKPACIFFLCIRFIIILCFNLLRRPRVVLAPLFVKQNSKEKQIKGKKIKILRFISRLNIGGPSIHVHLLTKGLDREKFDSKLITGVISSQEGDMSYLFDNTKNKPIIIPDLQREISFIKDLRALPGVFRLLKQEKPDIVHTHTAKAGSVARMAAIFFKLLYGKNVKTVHTFHGHVFHDYFGSIKSSIFVFTERFMAKFTNAIVALSETQKNELVEKYKIAPGNKVRVIELGFDLNPFLSNESSNGNFRNKIHVDKDTKLIGIVGRLAPIKNHIMFFDSAKLLLDSCDTIPIKFVVVGDGELKHEIIKYCTKIGISEKVIFCGWVKDVASVYSDLDILALTSLNEGTPVSIIEAMASSVPVISTNAGGVVDLIGNPVSPSTSNGFTICDNGVLCKINDSNGFANGIKYLLENESARIKIVKSACSFVKRKYVKERLISNIEILYKDLLQE